MEGFNSKTVKLGCTAIGVTADLAVATEFSVIDSTDTATTIKPNKVTLYK